MHGSRSKISSKNLVKQRCAEGYNSGVKGLINHHIIRVNVLKISVFIQLLFTLRLCMSNVIFLCNFLKYKYRHSHERLAEIFLICINLTVTRSLLFNGWGGGGVGGWKGFFPATRTLYQVYLKFV
jgi:hypothetical protein